MSFWCWSLFLCCVAIGVSPGFSPAVSLCVSYIGGHSVRTGFSQSGSHYSCYAGENFCRAIAIGKFGGAFWWAILVGHFCGPFCCQMSSQMSCQMSCQLSCRMSCQMSYKI